MATAILERARQENWSDEEVVARVLAGETAVYEIIMRRYNQRLYRVARAILRDDAEAEDVMQETYVRALQHLRQFQGRAQFSTWLTRIAVNEALARVRQRGRIHELEAAGGEGDPMTTLPSNEPDPETRAGDAETRHLLETAVLELPESYRAVVMLRDIEEMSTADTAAALGLSEDNVKIRLHRARAMLRRTLYKHVGATSATAFQFHAVRCDRVVNGVFARLTQPGPSGEGPIVLWQS
ncbi:MAG: RNA polymerase sigma factor [Terriglobales bacterium]